MAAVEHKYCTETIYHFSCGKCEKWWSVSDWKIVDVASCPHCGTLANVAMSVSEHEAVDRVC